MKKTPRPHNIKKEQLPKNVWWQQNGNGCWMIKQKDTATNTYKSSRLCQPNASINQIWQAYNARQDTQKQTFKSISIAYQNSARFKKLSALTQKDYQHCHNKICQFAVKNGLLCDYSITAWTPGTVARYRDAREQESQSRAWKEITYIKTVFAWAMEYEYAQNNPARDIKKPQLKPRQHYATDKDFYFLLDVAKQNAQWYMPFALQIAYLCRMRLSEVIDLTDSHETETGLYISRLKGSKDNIVAWTPELKEIWTAAKHKRNAILKAHSMDIATGHIIISERTGDRITAYGLKVAKSRLDKIALDIAEKQGIDYTHFTFHDLKRKGITDTDGTLMEKLDASGHKSASMMNTYDVSIKVVKPSK